MVVLYGLTNTVALSRENKSQSVLLAKSLCIRK